ncbi:MAG: hypothetical protein WCG26_14820 [Chloroflexales bacterium]
MNTPTPLAELRAYLNAIANGGEPFGPPPADISRRAHDTAIPDLLDSASVEGAPARRSPAARPAAPPAWPDMPLDAIGRRSIAGAQIGQAVQALLADPDITGEADDAGLTPARMRAALVAGGFDASASGRMFPCLALWLALAGALAAPADAAAPWASPRPLTSRDTAALQAMLRAAPPPSPDAVAEERGRGLKG